MPNIPIKINHAAKPSGDNGNLSVPAAKKLNWLLWSLAAALIITAVWLAFLLLTGKKSVFAEILPSNPAAIVYFDHQKTLADSQKLLNGGFNWPPFSWAAQKARLAEAFGEARAEDSTGNDDLNRLKEKLAPLFADQMAFVWLDNADIPPKWLLLAELKIPAADFSSRLVPTENNLKQRYNLIGETYRQIKITGIKRLDENPDKIYYASLKNYFIVSNNAEVVKGTIDKIME